MPGRGRAGGAGAGDGYECVVLISLDTLRSDLVNANPYKLWPARYRLARDPGDSVLDDLARAGAFFPNCITAAPYTSAAHGSFLTGRWPLRHKLYGLFNQRLRGVTVLERARRLGLRTVMKVDFPLILGDRLGFTRGVDEYYAEDDDAFLRSLGRGGPLFGFAHFGGLHVPYGFHNLRFGGQAYVDKVAELEAELGDEPDPLAGADGPGREHAEALPPEVALMVRYRRAVQRLYAQGRYDRLFELYLEGAEHFLRTRFAPFLERLLELVGGRRYLLVLFGDHGEEYGEDSYGHQDSLSEGVIRVPVLLFGPGVRAGLHPGRIRSVDVAPTVLEVIGDRGRGRLRLDGVTLAGTVWRGEPYDVRTAFSQAYVPATGDYLDQVRLAGGGSGRRGRHLLYKEAVYEGRHRLTRRHADYRQTAGTWALERRSAPAVALETVDAQLTPHAVDDSPVAARLGALLDSYNRSGGDGRGERGAPDDIRRQLQAMGYRI